MVNLSTAYPFVYIHGVLAHDQSATESNVWGRIPVAVRSRGGRVFFGHQDSFGTVHSNADQLERTIAMVLEATNASKVHLIAHSKGGLDSRCLAHRPSMAGCIASVTTFATPHGGLRTSDHLLNSNPARLKRIARSFNRRATRDGDAHADFLGVLQGLSTQVANEFNQAYPDLPEIEYRAYGAAPQQLLRSPRGAWIHWFVNRYDGDNDGLVPLWSAKREPWALIEAVRGEPGLNHNDVIDQRKRNTPIRVSGGKQLNTVVNLHLELVRALAPIV